MTDAGVEPQRHEQVERAMAAAAELLDHGWPRDAVEPLSAALAIHGDDAAVLRLLAVAYWSAGDVDDARTCVHRSIATDPDDVDGYRLAAALASDRGDLSEARSALAAAVDLRPADGALAAEQLFLDLRADRVDTATYRAAARAAAAHPADADVNVALAWLAEREGYDGTAARAVAAAVRARPADPWTRWLLVRSHERRGGTIAVIADAALVLAERPEAAGPLGALRRGSVRLTSLGNAFLLTGVIVAGLGTVLDGAAGGTAPFALAWCAVVLLAVVVVDLALGRRLARALRTGWRPYLRVVRREARGALVAAVIHALTVTAAVALLVLVAVGAPGVSLAVAGAVAGAGLLVGTAATPFLDRWYWS